MLCLNMLQPLSRRHHERSQAERRHLVAAPELGSQAHVILDRRRHLGSGRQAQARCGDDRRAGGSLDPRRSRLGRSRPDRVGNAAGCGQAEIGADRYDKTVTPDEVKGILAAEVEKVLAPVAAPLVIAGAKPFVILVAGVNGSGKTTTIGKLAAKYRGEGRAVVLAAGDTFRAAAIDQ